MGKEISPGTFGENLTISELESALFNIGDHLQIEDVRLQVSAPRIPGIDPATHNTEFACVDCHDPHNPRLEDM